MTASLQLSSQKMSAKWHFVPPFYESKAEAQTRGWPSQTLEPVCSPFHLTAPVEAVSRPHQARLLTVCCQGVLSWAELQGCTWSPQTGRVEILSSSGQVF